MEGGRERVRRQGGAYGEAGNRNTRYKMQQICHLGTSPLGLSPRYIFRKLFFTSKICLADSMPKYRAVYTLFVFIVDNTRKIFKSSAYLAFWGKPLGFPQVLYISRKLFLWATFASQIVSVYLEPIKKYKASKLTMLKKYSKCNIFRLIGDALEKLPPRAIHFYRASAY